MQSGEQREILETFRMFVDDRGWLERVREAIGSGLTAEAGVQRAFDDVRTRLGQSTDPYIRERLSDLQDLTNRLLLRLTGRVAADPSVAARRHDRHRPRHGAGRAARLRPHAAARPGARGRLGDEPRRDRGARARHSRRRPRARRAGAHRAGRCHRGRRRQRPGAGAAGRGHPADRPCRDRGARRAPAQVRGAARPAVGDARSGAHRRCT